MIYSGLFFLLVFFPFVLATYFGLRWIVPSKQTWYRWWLVVVSMLFYVWGASEAFWVLPLLIVINYIIVRMMLMHGARSKIWLVVGLTVNVCIWAGLKYLGSWQVSSIQIPGWQMAEMEWNWSTGISFLVLAAISLQVDVFRNKKAAGELGLKLTEYLSFFPKLLAGPVAQYEDFSSQKIQVSSENVEAGMKRLIVGLAKKVIIADSLAKVAEIIFSMTSAEISPTLAWFGVLVFGLQILFDFSGYTDIAIGIARMLGHSLPENFNYPYMATSVREFWQRWHMSLMKWFRDYIYIPLGGSRRGRFRLGLNIMMVFLISGIWHGMGWNFVMWGVYFGVMVAGERLFWGRYISRIGRLGMVYTWFVVGFGWVLFRNETLAEAVSYTGDMMRLVSSGIQPAELLWVLDTRLILIVLVALLWATPLFALLGSWWKRQWIQLFGTDKGISLISGVSYLCLYGVCLAVISSQTYNPFIYFQF